MKKKLLEWTFTGMPTVYCMVYITESKSYSYLTNKASSNLQIQIQCVIKYYYKYLHCFDESPLK